MSSTSRKALIRGLIIGGLAAACLILPFVVETGLDAMGRRVLAIFGLAVLLWVTEAIPLHATAVLIIILNILLISNQALIPFAEGSLDEGRPIPGYATFFHALANPVLMLFLGGFFLADGAARFQLDKSMARVMLRPFGRRPSLIMLGLMLITAVFSMFMSNTATTATMMAVVLPVIVALPAGDRRKIALALCIPFAANIGGMGTPVGTPPNAIALGALARQGLPISFLLWMVMIVPFMLVLLAAAWQILDRLYPCSVKELDLDIRASFDTSRPAIIFYATFALTVGLWLTEPLHGMNSNVIGFVPVVILLGTGVFGVRELQSTQWHVLWLVAGGIALGSAVSASGFDSWIIGLIRFEALSGAWILAILALVALGLSTVISNSATANLLVPIGMTLTMQIEGINRVQGAVFIAVGASLAMSLPISTPPNAIAYSTGVVKSKDMILVGAIIGAIGWLLFTWVAPMVWDALNLMPTPVAPPPAG